MGRIDYLNIGSCPADEECAQVGAEDYRERSRIETQAYIEQLRREYGPEPDRASLRVKVFPHDFGSYREVVCYYDDEDEAAIAYAYAIESGEKSDGRWDQPARATLAKAGYGDFLKEKGENDRLLDALRTVLDRGATLGLKSKLITAVREAGWGPITEKREKENGTE